MYFCWEKIWLISLSYICAVASNLQKPCNFVWWVVIFNLYCINKNQILFCVYNIIMIEVLISLNIWFFFFWESNNCVTKIKWLENQDLQFFGRNQIIGIACRRAFSASFFSFNSYQKRCWIKYIFNLYMFKCHSSIYVIYLHYPHACMCVITVLEFCINSAWLPCKCFASNAWKSIHVKIWNHICMLYNCILNLVSLFQRMLVYCIAVLHKKKLPVILSRFVHHVTSIISRHLSNIWGPPYIYATINLSWNVVIWTFMVSFLFSFHIHKLSLMHVLDRIIYISICIYIHGLLEHYHSAIHVLWAAGGFSSRDIHACRALERPLVWDLKEVAFWSTLLAWKEEFLMKNKSGISFRKGGKSAATQRWYMTGTARFVLAKSLFVWGKLTANFELDFLISLLRISKQHR